MKKLPILLIFFGFAAHAEWQLVHTDGTAARYFVDVDNLRIINGYRRAWILNDLGKSNGHGQLGGTAQRQRAVAQGRSQHP